MLCASDWMQMDDNIVAIVRCHASKYIMREQNHQRYGDIELGVCVIKEAGVGIKPVSTHVFSPRLYGAV